MYVFPFQVLVRHDIATFVPIQFDIDNKIFGLPRELVVTVAGKRSGAIFLVEGALGKLCLTPFLESMAS